MARVTPSLDGQPRMTLRVEFRVGREDLIRVLCSRTTKVVDWREDLPEHPSRDRILTEAKTSYRFYGEEGVDYWRDEITDEEEADEIEEWATAAVDRAFPALSRTIGTEPEEN